VRILHPKRHVLVFRVPRLTICRILTGCVLEESDVASPEMLKRLDSKNSRHQLLKTLRSEGSGVHAPLLGILKHERHFPLVKFSMLAVVWLVFFAVQVLRGGKSSPVSALTPKPSGNNFPPSNIEREVCLQSLLNLEPCKRAYWLLTASQVPLAFLLTGWAAWHLHHTPAKNSPPELQVRAQTMLHTRCWRSFFFMFGDILLMFC
jgi:hypothetical protein